MTDPRSDPATRTMIDNLAAKSGRSLDDWVALVRAEGLDRHAGIIGFLKTEHGMTHGYANLVASVALNQPSSEEDLVAQQYAGPKAPLRPLYEAVLARVRGFGDDVEVAPKKTYVSLRRHRQFALLKPATRTQIEIGLNLKREAEGARLVPTTGMCTHLVRISGADELDPELEGWLRAAYEGA